MDPAQQYVEKLLRQLAGTGLRLAGTRVMTAPALAAAMAAGANVLGGPVSLHFNEPGTVLALVAQELAGTLPKYATTEVRIQIGDDDVFSDGRTGTFMPLLAMLGPTQGYFPLIKRADQNLDWTITWRNQDGGATAMPFLGAVFLPDRALAR